MTLDQRVDEMFRRADQPTGTDLIENSVLGLHLTEAGWNHASVLGFHTADSTTISEGPEGVFSVNLLSCTGRLVGTFTVRAIRDEAIEPVTLREAA